MINSYFAVHSNDKLIIFRTNIVLDRESKDKYRFSAIPLTEEGETIKVRRLHFLKMSFILMLESAMEVNLLYDPFFSHLLYL